MRDSICDLLVVLVLQDEKQQAVVVTFKRVLEAEVAVAGALEAWYHDHVFA